METYEYRIDYQTEDGEEIRFEYFEATARAVERTATRMFRKAHERDARIDFGSVFKRLEVSAEFVFYVP